MARGEFIDNLRHASRMLPPPAVRSEQGSQADSHLRSSLHSADLWLTPMVVGGFNPDDFTDLPEGERGELAKEVAAFRAIAEGVPPDKPAPRSRSVQAREHLERSINIVRRPLLAGWLEAQNEMLKEATAAAKSKGWFFEEDEKEISEGLLGTYKAPRLRIRAQDKEVVLDPIARFGSGRRGIVDLVVMPGYETAYLITFKDGHWQILSPRGTLHGRPFNRATLINTINSLPAVHASY